MTRDQTLHLVGSAPPPLDLDAVRERLPHELDHVLGAAVDPLEIAAALEAAGVSNRVVQSEFGRADLFALADELYEDRREASGPARADARLPRSGAPADLALGLLFVVPTVSFAAATRAAHLTLAWWALPLALTAGWAFSQALTGAILIHRGRGVDPAPVVVPGLVASVVGPAAIALLAMRLFGGGGVGVVVTVSAFSLYVASLGVLLERREAGIVVAALAPSLVVAVAYLAGAQSRPMRAAVLGAVGVTVLATLVAALRHGRLVRWSPSSLAPHERRLIATFFAYGACCGLAVSTVAVVAQGSKGLGPVFLVTLPVMATIGIVEWQLHTFRARTTRSLLSSHTVSGFERRAIGAFTHSTSRYLVALLGATGIVALGAAAAHYPLPSWPLAAEDVVGVTFFVGLVAATCSAIDLAVRSWLTGVVVFGLGLALLHALGLAADHTALDVVTLSAAVVALSSMVASALGVLRLPFHYQV